MPFQTSSNQYQISKYIVDAIAVNSPYNTIQSAINAANTAGVDATINIRPGTYTENLTLYDGIDLVGQNIDVIIIGQHTPPAAGTFRVFSINFQHTSSVLYSNVAGTTSIEVFDCVSTIANGFFLELPNWTGAIEIELCDLRGTDNGVFHNVGGASITFGNSIIGNGTARIMNLSGNGTFYSCDVRCPIALTSGSLTSILMGSTIRENITTSDTATLTVLNSSFETDATQPITHGSTGDITLSSVSIDTSNATAIGGTGDIEITGVNFLDSNTLAATLTITRASVLNANNLRLDGFPIYVPTTTQNIVAGTGITAAMHRGIIRVQGSGGAVIVTATPSIVDGVDGQVIIIQGDDDTNTVTLQDESSLANTGLQLSGGANFTLGLGDILQLTYDAGEDKYFEISRSNN